MKAKIQNYIAKDNDSNSDDIYEMLDWTAEDIAEVLEIEAELGLKEMWDKQVEKWRQEALKCEAEFVEYEATKRFFAVNY